MKVLEELLKVERAAFENVGDSLRVATAGLPPFSGRRNVAEAAEGVVGAPALSVTCSRRNLKFGADATAAYLYRSGTVMVFR